MKSYKNIKGQLLKDKQTKVQYEKLGPEFELVELIIKKRLEQGLTQLALAKKLNTKQSAISRLERGDYNPSVAFLNRVAKALDAELRISIH
ncbi:MAG: helix-turn-helix transcriptional regulator [Candidatus Buchananbacteria bacterium]|nr:helix-turn-helix transcriptional regulator [Candidatus Buchananbacteria bacterium]